MKGDKEQETTNKQGETYSLYCVSHGFLIFLVVFLVLLFGASLVAGLRTLLWDLYIDCITSGVSLYLFKYNFFGSMFYIIY